MKRNVDLTESRIFTNQNEFDIFRSLVRRHLYDKYPWNFTKEFEYSESRNQIIITGNKTERSLIKDMSDSRICQRCGKVIRIPWHIRYELCKKCDTILSNDTHDKHSKCPWNNGINIIIS